MLTQLDPPLPMESPKGSGVAHFVIDYGPESDLLWVVFLDGDGTCWAIPNPEIRLRSNWSLGRRSSRANGVGHEPIASRPEVTSPGERAPRLTGGNARQGDRRESIHE